MGLWGLEVITALLKGHDDDGSEHCSPLFSTGSSMPFGCIDVSRAAILFLVSV